MGDLAQRVDQLEDDYVELMNDHNKLEAAHEAVLCALEEATQEIKDLDAELEWYRSTFPEGSDAYACMRRME